MTTDPRPARLAGRSFGAMLAVALVALGFAGCQGGNEAILPMDQVKADLETASRARIFFGHQSVGRNILAGVEALARDAGVPLRIVEVPVGSAPGDGPALYHANVGLNEMPEKKVDDFVASLRAAEGAAYDVAILKFCYVDLEEGSAPDAVTRIVSRYEDAVRELQERQARTTLVHTTMPLMSDPPGWKTGLKRVLGKSTWRDAGNMRRADYNRSIRGKFQSGEFLDLAKVESTRPNGSVASFSADGREIETLALEYTDDGGHLNEAGQRRVAAAFLRSLAQAVQRNAAVTSGPAPEAQQTPGS